MKYFMQVNLYFNPSTASQAQQGANNTDKHHSRFVIIYWTLFYFNACTVYLLILYSDQQMHNYFTNYHTPTCFDTIVSSSGSL